MICSVKVVPDLGIPQIKIIFLSNILLLLTFKSIFSKVFIILFIILIFSLMFDFLVICEKLFADKINLIAFSGSFKSSYAFPRAKEILAFSISVGLFSFKIFSIFEIWKIVSSFFFEYL